MGFRPEPFTVFMDRGGLVPKIGTMSSPWASTQARASWDGVHFFRQAIASTRATSSRFLPKFSP
jgi:hypothetical protein